VRAATWILFVAILAAGCSGGSGDREAKSGSARPKPSVEKQQAQGDSASSHAGKRPKSAVARKPTTKNGKPTKKSGKQKPRQRSRALPWRPDGISQVVHVRVRRLAVYKSPRAKKPVLVLRKRDPRGTQRAFLVRSMREKWVRVYLPTRPNGSQGWVRKRAVRSYTNGYRLVIRLRTHKLNLWRGTKLLDSYPVAVGTRSTPTPRGLYYIVELLKPRSPHGSYGPYSFGLSAHSTVLKRFAGGDGRVGLHGTNQPSLIGSDVSHGCIRLKNGAIRRLAKILPLGTPVYIRF
jgi:lipoprotein-anchoring transpeptidase ErfK/SrfK